MTGYQKLKKENEILWEHLTAWIEEVANYKFTKDIKTQETFKRKEIAYIEALIRYETK